MPDSKKHQSENTQNEGILAPVDQANLPEEEGTKSTSETSENKNATDISVKTSRVKYGTLKSWKRYFQRK